MDVGKESSVILVFQTFIINRWHLQSPLNYKDAYILSLLKILNIIEW